MSLAAYRSAPPAAVVPFTYSGQPSASRRSGQP